MPVPLEQTGSLVADARAARAAALAFNVIGLEHAEAVVAAADATRRPVILQVSANAVRFRGGIRPLAAALAALAEEATAPVALHLDHAEDLELCRAAAAAGFSSVMFDAAADEYDRNVAATSEVAQWARSAGVWLEAELGEIAGKPGARAGEATDPDEARAYVAATGADALAVAVGSRHKMTEATARLDLERIALLREAIDVPLVLHGSSGVPDDHLREAIDAGMTKINVGTRLGTAFTAAVRDVLAAADGTPDPRKLLAPARAAMTDVASAMLERLSAPAA